MKNHIITFCDSVYWASRIDYFIKESNNMDIFDEVKIYTEKTIDEEFQNIINTRLSDTSCNNNRGYCFWSWKSHIIKDYMTNYMEDGDILMYLDSGCTLNSKGKMKLKEIIDKISNTSEFITTISLAHNGIPSEYQEHRISECTKPSLLQKIQCMYNKGDELRNGICYEAGFIIVKKCTNGIQFINEYDYICNEMYDYITDKILIPEDEYYITNDKHRHDQSVFSMLCNIYGIQECLNYFEDCWLNTNDYHDYYDKLPDNPVWFTRTKTEIGSYCKNKTTLVIYGNNDLSNKISNLNIVRNIVQYDSFDEDLIESWKHKITSVFNEYIKLEEGKSIMFIDSNVHIEDDTIEESLNFFLSLLRNDDRIFFYDNNILNKDICKKSGIFSILNFLTSSYGDMNINELAINGKLNCFSIFILKKTKENTRLIKDIMFINNILSDYITLDKVWDSDLEWVDENKISINTNPAFSIITRSMNNLVIDLNKSVISLE